jgi:hypothetical protein
MKKLTLVLALLTLAACAPNFSSGERIGIVTKLSEKGLIFKSWEGSMLIALPIEVAGSTTPEEFEFNVDPAVVQDVQKAMQSGKRVTLVYRQWCMCPWSIDHNHVIVAVKGGKNG